MTDTTHPADQHSLRIVVFMIVVTIVQLFDLVLDLRIDRFTTEDGRAFRDLANLAGDSASVLFVVLLVILAVVAFRDRRPLTRMSTPRWILIMMIVFLGCASLNVLMNIATLVVSPSLKGASQTELILDLALLYGSTTLIFSLWYQLADVYLPGGAFEFPPNAAHPDQAPQWFDYLSLSFYTNSTFGPTLESVKTRPAKALKMVQTSLSLIVLVVLIARIIRGI